MGPSGELQRLRVTENPKIPRKVESLSGGEVPANEALHTLYDDHFDVYYLANVLASGAFGVRDKQRLVPTRWSITAVDDTVAKQIVSEIKDYPSINEISVHSNVYLDNRFEVLLLPGAWEFEQFEAWSPNTPWTKGQFEPVIAHEYEGHRGRKAYAFEEGGGYYAGRIAVAEHLRGIRRQARVVVFREVYDGYVVPLGVWQVRENVRQAMKNEPVKFQTLKEALSEIQKRLTIPLKSYLEKSVVLRQRRLSDFGFGSVESAI
ncbi:Uncharacterised protein [uncultured archaeon]|nr:Uncharacterised protein [uncultured archaeon]